MEYNKVSRKDDLISLCYLLIFMANGTLPFSEIPNYLSMREVFDLIYGIKKALPPQKLCCDNAKDFLPFVEEIFSLEFKQDPIYDRLRFSLIKVLL